MPYQYQHGPSLLGIASQLRCAITHLRDAARGRGQRFAVYHLNRIHYQHLGLQCISGSQNGVDIRFRHELKRISGQSKPVGSHGNLLGGLLASNVQRWLGFSQLAQCLQQQRALAGTRVPADQNARAGDKTPTKNPVKLVKTRAQPRQIDDRNVLESLHRSHRPCIPGAATRSRSSLARRRAQADF